MQSDELDIDFKWIGRQTGNQVERAFFADIGLRIGGVWLTRLDDQEASTVRTHLRACAHRLATWFAANWWRLRWEPETRSWGKDPDWRSAHSLATTGGGYVWPNVVFASDGESIAIASRPGSNPIPFEPIRYLTQFDGRITAAEFERKVDAFMASVLSRMDSLDIADDALQELWMEVQQERRDPDAARRRKLEALCGYDPDDAPPELVDWLIKDEAGLGQGTLEEVAAHGRHSTARILGQILELEKPGSRKKSRGYRGTMPALTPQKAFAPGARPWQKATELARLARKEWGLGKLPITNKHLADLLGFSPMVFSDRSTGHAPLPLALREGNEGGVSLYINKKHPTSRRFAIGRLLGDHLHHTNGGRLIAATDVKTSRQQFQRAFAQEFLCPFVGLLEKIQTEDPNDDDIEEAASYFEVSPWVVKTTLVNKGELDREALNWSE